MSDYDVSPSEMKRLSNISDSDLDAMRAGHVRADDSSLDAISRFVRDLGEAYPEPSTEHLEDVHVAAMLHAAQLTAEKGEPVTRPVSKANGPASQASGLPKPWRETIMNKLLATRGAKVAAATIAMILALSGVAVAGVLPDSVQDPIADAAKVIGVDLPGGADEIEAAEFDEGDVEDADETAIEDIDDIDGSDQDDDEQGDDSDEDRDDQDDEQDAAGSSSDDDDDGDRDDEESSINKPSDRSEDADDRDSDSADDDDEDDDDEDESASESHDEDSDDEDSDDEESDEDSD